jgi:hypothetical protein
MRTSRPSLGPTAPHDAKGKRFCIDAFQNRRECPRGAGCPWRHHQLQDDELMGIAAITQRRTALVDSYWPQTHDITSWDSRT